ncbi:hypothetical protein A7D00_3138 [Trichophyton violaceum]|uniref:Transcription factor TFIIIC triple barrel domain-containing protein n=1 Tax=Trichophyton violaceum TaxID=34388 RepID=A0A178FHX0_TRIVO|nr:hypothetical protein A7D00_3138 [Trichophyton violaceum]
MDRSEAIAMDVDGDGTDYEYEYDPIETETAYINLELSSVNGPIRPPRKRSSTSTPIHSPIDPSMTPSLDGDGGQDHNDQEQESQSRIQIMDLHSPNPIISYGNQIFSCSWADMIGTELMFTRSSERQPSSSPPLWRNEEDSSELLCANRVRIVGQKANLISSSGGQSQSVFGEDLGDASRIAMSNQARFLTRLAKAKHSRGETDAVRTVFPLKKSQIQEEKIAGWNRVEAAVAEAERLNKLALEGDGDAMRALQQMYAERSGSGQVSNQGSRGSGVQAGSTTPTASEPAGS